MSAPQSPPLDYRQLPNEEPAKTRELDLREREVAAKEREVAAREKEVARSWVQNPLLVAIAGAFLALIANFLVTLYSNRATADIERNKAEAALVLELIKADRKTTCTNLRFAKEIGFLRDKGNLVESRCQGDLKDVPTLPQAQNFPSTDEASGELLGRVLDDEKVPLEGVEITPTDAAPTVVKTDSDGYFRMVIRGMNITAIFNKPGYLPRQEKLSRYQPGKIIILTKNGH